jgi:hypothetical protein
MPDSHVVVGEYYFSAEQTLRHIQITPSYHYKDNPEHWIEEYDHITAYITGMYGESVSMNEHDRIVWQSAKTQAQLIFNSILLDGTRIQLGWIVRFDPIPKQGGKTS